MANQWAARGRAVVDIFPPPGGEVKHETVRAFVLWRLEEEVQYRTIRKQIYAWNRFIEARGGTGFLATAISALFIEQALNRKDRASKPKAPVSLALLALLTQYLGAMESPALLLGEGKGKRVTRDVFLLVRNSALLNMMFFGLLRRSDAFQLTVGDVRAVHEDYVQLRIQNSKTD